MKRIIAALTLATLFVFPTYAQTVLKEGEIIFGAEWQLPPGAPEGLNESLPKEISSFYKGTKTYSKIAIEVMGQETVVRVFMDNDPLQSTPLMDMMGQKFGIRTSTEDFKKIYDTLKVEFEYLKEYKDIIGYKSQKVMMNNKSTNERSEMWVTEELALPANQYTMYFKGLKGVPLEFNQTQNGMKIKLIAKKLIEKTLPDDLFAVPDGYQVISLEEALKMGFQN